MAKLKVKSNRQTYISLLVWPETAENIKKMVESRKRAGEEDTTICSLLDEISNVIK